VIEEQHYWLDLVAGWLFADAAFRSVVHLLMNLLVDSSLAAAELLQESETVMVGCWRTLEAGLRLEMALLH